MHEVLVNRLGGLSLPRKSVVRLTDRPDMTLDVYRGRKTTIQQQQSHNTQPNSAVGIDFLWLIDDFYRYISIRDLSKYLRQHSNNCKFLFFIYRSTATLGCHSNKISEWICIKNYYCSPPPPPPPMPEDAKYEVR